MITTPDDPTNWDVLIYSLIIISAPVLVHKIAKYWQRTKARQAYLDRSLSAFRLAWSYNTRYAALIGLVERYLYGEEPGGPWDAWRIREHWPDKNVLKRLTRGGVIPLEIYSGGLRTYQKKRLSFYPDETRLPVYAQSKGRAYFYFVVIYPLGQHMSPQKGLNTARIKFMQNLFSQDRYPVTASYFNNVDDYTHTRTTARLRHSEDFLEAGATSRCKYFLPFKRDRVLKSGQFERRKKETGIYQHLEGVVTLEDFIDDPKTSLPLLGKRAFCIVRIESLDFSPVRLDEYVYELARDANFMDLWPEDEASRAVAALYDQFGLDWRANPK
jgi:hypothetical protein